MLLHPCGAIFGIGLKVAGGIGTEVTEITLINGTGGYLGGKG